MRKLSQTRFSKQGIGEDPADNRGLRLFILFSSLESYLRSLTCTQRKPYFLPKRSILHPFPASLDLTELKLADEIVCYYTVLSSQSSIYLPHSSSVSFFRRFCRVSSFVSFFLTVFPIFLSSFKLGVDW